MASSNHVANSANSDVPLHRSLHELQDNARAIAHTHQMLSNEEQDAEVCGEPHGSEDTRFLHSLTHPNTPPPEEADELLDTQRQASLLDSAQLLFEKKMMMEVINGEQVTFRRMDEILENVTHALDYHCGRLKVLSQRLADSGANWRGWSHKSNHRSR